MRGQIDQFARETGTRLEDAYNATYQAVSAGIDPATAGGLSFTSSHMAATAGRNRLDHRRGRPHFSALNAYGLEVWDNRPLCRMICSPLSASVKPPSPNWPPVWGW